MNTISILGHGLQEVSLPAFVERLGKLKTLPFFDQGTIEFCDNLSREIMLATKKRSVPELTALAFWLRRAEVTKLKQSISKDQILHPRGLAFHIPPANVDTIFIYSWVLSVLCGNTNVVRLSKRSGENARILIDLFFKVLAAQPTEVEKNTLFVNFPHSQETLQAISEVTDLRLVWGGDRTVNDVRQVPLKPRGLDIGFANRFSYALISATKINELAPEELSELTEKFYNDSYVFNQKACSSPRVIFWVGNGAESIAAMEKFFDFLKSTISRKRFHIDAPLAMYKLKSAYKASLSNHFPRVTILGPEIVNMEFKNLSALEDLRALDDGGGSFYSTCISTIEELESKFIQKDQTLSYFGFAKEEIIHFARNLSSKGIDRIVPVGKALSFNNIWDGQNLIQTFSREIYVE